MTAQVHRQLEVGVVEHHQRVLAAHLELHLGDARGAVRRPGADADRAGEADRVDSGAFDEALADDRAAAHHQVEHAGRQAGALMISASAQAQPGTRSAGLNTTQLP